MSKTLGGLMKLLLERVAICGANGATPAEIATWTRAYYFDGLNVEAESDPEIYPAPLNIDNVYLEYVWRLLVDDPDISFGYNSKSKIHKSKVVAFAEAVIPYDTDEQVNSGPHGQKNSVASSDHVDAAVQANTSSLPADLAPQPAATEAGTQQMTGKAALRLRLFTTESRIWQTVAGHDPDTTRIKNLDFIALSAIAAAGPRGVLQHELPELTGQDQRSLPTRTTRLARLNYIVKENLVALTESGLLHTALNTHWKYPQEAAERKVELATEARAYNDQHKKGWRRRVAFRDEAENSASKEVTTVEQTEEIIGAEAQSAEAVESEKDKVVSQWSPDRPLYSHIYDIVDKAGEDGATVQTVSRSSLGMASRRDMDHCLSRAVQHWQVTQPKHLRHLAIVRDTIMQSKSPVYNHYTFENYHRMVIAGTNGKTWEAVSILKVGSKFQGCEVRPVDDDPVVDENGFPALNPGRFLTPDNETTLMDIMPPSGLFHYEQVAANGQVDQSVHAAVERPKSKPGPKKKSRPSTEQYATDSKTRGRPRKINPETLPDDISGWTPADILRVEKSLRAAEKYQTSKIQSEIDRRVEAGQNGAKAARDVLEETADDLQKRKETLSTFVVSQILHEYAGEPLLTAEQDASLRLRNEIVKAATSGDMQFSYRPSIAAHSSAFPHWRSLDPLKSLGPRKLGRPAGETNVIYLPSVAAHGGLPDLRPIQKAKTVNVRGGKGQNSISRTAHAANAGEIDASLMGVAPKKRVYRKRKADGDSSTPLPKAAKKLKLAEPFYEQMAMDIDRTNNGLYIGPTSQHSNTIRRSQFKKPTSTKLAIFRLPALRTKNWFRGDQSAVPDRSESNSAPPMMQSSDAVTMVQPAASSRSQQDTSPQSMRTAPEGSSSPQDEFSNVFRGLSAFISLLGAESKPQSSTSKTANTSRPASKPQAAWIKDQPAQHVRHSVPPPRPILRASEPIPKMSLEGASADVPQMQQGPENSLITHNLDLGLAEEAELHALQTPRASRTPTPIAVSRPELPQSTELPEDRMVAPDINRAQDTATVRSLSPTVDVSASPEPLPVKKPRKSRANKEQNTPRLRRNAGSTAVIRRDIVMHLVIKCDGVAPGAKALALPFGAEWRSRGYQGDPDIRTVSKAVDDLRAAGRLHQVVFSFKTRTGRMGKSDLLMIPDIDPSDHRVREMQQAISKSYPTNYIPLICMPESGDGQPSEIVKSPDQSETPDAAASIADLHAKQHFERKQVTVRRNAREKAILDEARSMRSKNTSERASYLSSLHSTELDNKTIILLTKLAQPVQRGRRLDSVHGAPAPNLKTSLLRPRLIAPSFTRRGAVPAAPPRMSFPLADRALYGTIGAWDPSRVEPKSLALQSTAPLIPVVSPRPDQTDHNIRTSDRMQEILQRAVRIEQNQTMVSVDTGPKTPFLVGADEEEFEELFRHMENQLGVDPQLEIDSQLDMDMQLSDAVATPRKRKRRKPLSKAFCMTPAFMDPVHVFHPSTGTLSATFSGFRPGKYPPVRKTVRRTDHHRHSYVRIPLGWDVPLPHVYATIPSTRSARGRIDSFEVQVDRLEEWEIKQDGHRLIKQGQFKFVNHEFPGAHKTHGKSNVDMEESFLMIFRNADDEGEIVSATSYNGLAYVRQNEKELIRRSREKQKIFRTSLPASHDVRPEQPDYTIDCVIAPSQTKRRNARQADLTDYEGAGGRADSALTAKPAKRRYVRRSGQHLPLTELEERRLVVAVSVVQTLVGGSRQHIDWSYVARTVRPSEAADDVRTRWRSIAWKYRPMKLRVEKDFQALFLAAYQNGEVSAPDYDRLDNYDWKALMEWTFARVDTEVDEKTPDLPIDRDTFDKAFETREDKMHDMNDFYEIEGWVLRSSRTANAAKTAHACPLARATLVNHRHSNPAVKSLADHTAIARTWIRANTVTPESQYNASAARARLNEFPDQALSLALKSLKQDRVVDDCKQSPLNVHRVHKLSHKVPNTLGRSIPPSSFREALHFKATLDSHFESPPQAALPVSKRRFRWDPNANNGTIMAMFDLVANGRLSMVSVDVPLDKFGHLDGGYISRQMDKQRLNFSIDLVPTATYVPGNPLLDYFEDEYGMVLSPPLPPGISMRMSKAEKIPLWINIHGGLITKLWELSVCAVLGTLIMRPGSGMKEMEETLKPSVEAWEIELVLEWLDSVDAVVGGKGQGWRTAEWWWMVLAVVDEVGG